MAGVVCMRMVDPGDTVSPGVPVIAVQAAANYRLEATVPESSAADLYVGKTVKVIVGADERTAEGRVAVISPAGDPSSHKFVVKVDLPPFDKLRMPLNARSGEFGRISFPVSFSSGVVVPQIAIHDEGGLPTVFVVDGRKRVRMQAVKVGRKADGGVEVLSGLTAGDRVIVENTGVLEDGAKVRIEGQ
jgi:membrane fusion protein, multidrug efflux system